ncbi:MAG TPA: alpha/beta hydrolase [Acidimicrobiales bacterium]
MNGWTSWEQLGRHRHLAGHDVFTIEVPARGQERREPLLVLHGFPSSSFDFHLVVDSMAEHRRVLLIDMVGYGLSSKPDRAYTMDLQADVVMAYTSELGVDRLALLTHDMGDTVGGELLARQVEGRWLVEVTERVVTNGSIYIQMAHLSAGQEVLLSLPDERLPEDAALDRRSIEASLAATFSPRSSVPEDELAAMSAMIGQHQGHLLLPRLIRYIEERRAHEVRFTGAIEAHPSPLSIVWGADDPIALVAMAMRLHETRPDAGLEILDGVGHYPMVEAPARFAQSVARALG